MTNNKVKCSNIVIANDKPFTLIAGPCQLENEKHALDVATKLKEITEKLKKIDPQKTPLAFENLFYSLLNKKLDVIILFSSRPLIFTFLILLASPSIISNSIPLS